MPTSFEQLLNLIGGKIGRFDVACPWCGPKCESPVNRKRKVLRIWYEGGRVIRFNCARTCGGGSATTKDPTMVKIKTRVALPPEPDKRKFARKLWRKSVPIEGTPAEVYLKSRKCFIVSPNIRYLPPFGKYPAAMIARFASRDGQTNGVHLTNLEPDGTKIKDGKQKIMIGPSIGCPIIIKSESENPAMGCSYALEYNQQSLCIAEGIEDAASMSIAMDGAAAWAAGSAGRIPKVIGKAWMYDVIYLAVDDDEAGQKALKAAQKIRPDIIPVNFTQAMKFDERMDANRVLNEYGVIMVQACCDWAENHHAAA